MTCIVKYGLTQIWILRLFLSCLFEYRHVPLGGGGAMKIVLQMVT